MYPVPKWSVPFFFFACFILTGSQTQAQNNGREIGLRLSNANNLEFMLRKQHSENKFTRFRAGLAQFGFTEINGSNIFSGGVGLAVGFETRKEIAPNFYFSHGLEPALITNFHLSPNNYLQSIRPSLGYILNFQYHISDRFAFGIEMVPAISATLNIADNSGLQDISVNTIFNTNLLALTFVHTFDKQQE